jgi:hypothetical protein
MYFYCTWYCIVEHEYDVPGHRTIVVANNFLCSVHPQDGSSFHVQTEILSSSPNSRKDSSYVIIKYIDKDTSNYKDFVD